MGPLLAFAITSALSTGLNAIGASAETRRRDALRRALMMLLNPEAQIKEANTLFSGYQRSPGYTGLRTEALNNASALSSAMQTSFARRGLGTSGIAAMALPAARSSFAQTFAGIDADLFTKALANARENLAARAKVLEGTSGPGTGELTAGRTIQAMMPNIMDLLKRYGLGGSAASLSGGGQRDLVGNSGQSIYGR